MKLTELVSFRTDHETKEKLKEIAEREERSISQVITRAIKEYYQKRQKEKENGERMDQRKD